MRDSQGEVGALTTKARDFGRGCIRTACGDDFRVQSIELRREAIDKRSAAFRIVLEGSMFIVSPNS